MATSTTASPMAPDTAAGVLSLKEWGAAIHALLDGRQTILLRKGGIHEKAFATPTGGGSVLLFPTVAHSHAERTRPEHHDLLGPGAADVDETAGTITVRAAVELVEVIEVARPDGLDALSDLHIWTTESIVADRVEFRPRKPLQILVVAASPLADPLVLPRLDAYGGCRSWIDLQTAPPRADAPIHEPTRLRTDADRVRAAVG